MTSSAVVFVVRHSLSAAKSHIPALTGATPDSSEIGYITNHLLSAKRV